MQITFDPAKSLRNVALRGLSFELLGDRVHALVFVETKHGIRVISFRKANQREVRHYEKASNP